MKKLTLILFAILILPHIMYAKAVAPKPGTIKKFSSSSKDYSIEIKFLGYPDNSPSECTLKKEGKSLWTKELPTTPGLVEISDDGKYFVFANWGWYDEGGYKSISFYNADGKLLKTIKFGSGKRGMKWLTKTLISKDGNFFITANGSSNNSQVSLYSVPKQTLLWAKKIGLEQIDNILISKTGNYILMSTFDYKKHNIHFSYLKKTGDVLWEKEIKKGHAWNKDLLWLSQDGMTFKVLDLNKNSWQLYENKKNKITPKK